ncbi:hypothetical protein PS3A_25380 [Pseudomonas sp. 3A(2025)]
MTQHDGLLIQYPGSDPQAAQIFAQAAAALPDGIGWATLKAIVHKDKSQ